jgi:hypothetical protein
MPFGKHKGEALEDLCPRYLEWLLTRPWLFADLRSAVEEELECRKAALERKHLEWLEQVPNDLPTARPCTVAGIELDATEAGLFAQAVAGGELTITPDLPVASAVERAWERWCKTSGRPHRVRELNPSPATFEE